MEMNRDLVSQLIKEINGMASEEVKIMEVCGTHTQMISRLGLRSLLSSNIKLLSGPGCPVCVTDEAYIDTAIAVLDNYPVTIATFGDLMRVRGTNGSLLEEKGRGKDIRVIYSPLDLIEMAQNNNNKKIVFLAVGFETTAPVIALAMKTAYQRGLKNLFFLPSLKRMPPILSYIFKMPNSKINGLICPGHVSSVMGSDYFKFLETRHGIPAAVCGFEALDIVAGIYHLVKEIAQNESNSFTNLYKRCVRPKGNAAAVALMEEVFKVSHGNWRGIGRVEDSALSISEKYRELDAEQSFKVEVKPREAISQCQCRDILLGVRSPVECRLFGKLCNPQNPHGACMVSPEGACSIAYRYREGI